MVMPESVCLANDDRWWWLLVMDNCEHFNPQFLVEKHKS